MDLIFELTQGHNIIAYKSITLKYANNGFLLTTNKLKDKLVLSDKFFHQYFYSTIQMSNPKLQKHVFGFLALKQRKKRLRCIHDK